MAAASLVAIVDAVSPPTADTTWAAMVGPTISVKLLTSAWLVTTQDTASPGFGAPPSVIVHVPDGATVPDAGATAVVNAAATVTWS